jgi:hypothetical protein
VTKLYADRDAIRQGQHYTKHVEAMTAEGLHSKADIAAELAHRDIEIERLRGALEKVCAVDKAAAGKRDCLIWAEMLSEAADALRPESER